MTDQESERSSGGKLVQFAMACTHKTTFAGSSSESENLEASSVVVHQLDSILGLP